MRTITIGRSNKCDIIIPDESVSSIHAEIMCNGNEFIYRDMGKNGTNIGGRMIHNERVTIASGTTVLLANRIPLPRAQIMRCCQDKAIYLPNNLFVWMLGDNPASSKEIQTPNKKDKLGIGWGYCQSLFLLSVGLCILCGKMKSPNALHWQELLEQYHL